MSPTELDPAVIAHYLPHVAALGARLALASPAERTALDLAQIRALTATCRQLQQSLAAAHQHIDALLSEKEATK